jgi:hypothetical protein
MADFTPLTASEIFNLLSEPDRKGTLLEGRIDLENQFDVTPDEFIKFAEDDLKSNTPHSSLNALSNSKRALDCQLDCALATLGYLDSARRHRWGLPQKLEWVQNLGLITPQILRRINRVRNLLEHEYVVPTRESVEAAFDVATLFIAYTKSVFNGSKSYIDYYYDRPSPEKESIHIKIRFDPSNKNIEVSQEINRHLDPQNPPETVKIRGKTYTRQGGLHSSYETAFNRCVVTPAEKSHLGFLQLFLNHAMVSCKR